MRTVLVDVSLASPLHERVRPAEDAARERIEQELAQAIADWGLPVRPLVHFETAPDHLRGQLARVRVDGRVCLLSAWIAAEALAYASNSPVVQSSAYGYGSHIPRLDVDEIAPEVLHETLALVVRAAVSARPDVLVPPDDPLAQVLRHGMSLVDEDLDVLRASISGGTAGAVLDRLAAPTIDLLIEPAYLKALTTDADGGELFAFMRDGLFVELGVSIPPMRVRLDPSLRARGFAFRVNATRTTPRIGLALDTIFVNDTAERLRLMNVTATSSVNSATNLPGAVTAATSQQMLEAAGLTVWNSFGYYILTLAATIRASFADVLTPARTRTMLDELGRAFPAVVERVPDQDVGDVLTPLLRSLLDEGISVLNLRKVVQLARCHAVAPEVAGGLDLLSFVRSRMADLIAHKASRGARTVVAYIVDPVIERELADRSTFGEELAEEIRNAFHSEIGHLPATAQIPVVLTAQPARAALRQVLRDEHPSVPVLAFTDLPVGVNVQPVARISR
jgi:hypothetical protein